jgi:hypothetical protein
MAGVSPDLERESLQRAGKTVENLRAEHRALVVDEREHDGPRTEKLPECDRLAGRVVERQIERNLAVELLVDADFPQRRNLLGRRLSGRRHGQRPARLRVRAGRDQQRGDDADGDVPHFTSFTCFTSFTELTSFFPASAAAPRVASPR